MASIKLEDFNGLFPQRSYGVIILPSMGRFYPKEATKDGMIEICPLTAAEEKLLGGIKGNNTDEIIDTLLKRCMVTDLDPNEMIITDRLYILMMLRANSYGEDYNFDLTCPYCELKANYNVKIPGDFEVVYAKESDKEPFEVILPVSKLKVYFNLLRGQDSKDIKRFAEKEAKRGGEGDPAYIYRLAKCIKSVDTAKGNKTFDDIALAMEFVSKLPAKDSTTLKNAIEDNTPGMLLTIKKDCVSCSKEIETDMPITAEFFRPKFTK